ncbi:MAG: hypothetical protein INH43_08330 [Acidobacteriaceae bacterium]|nr:hypothetical protein [Acidobacteriaceae bacterium]
MTLLDIRDPIDLLSPAWRTAAEQLQGNIVKPHGREHTTMLLFVFENRADLRAKLRNLASAFVTSAAKQQQQQSALATGACNEMFGNLALSAAGYRKLAWSEDALKSAFTHIHYNETWFLDGMRARYRVWGEPEQARLEDFYQTTTVDGYLLLACADRDILDQATTVAKNALGAFCRQVHEERGQLIKRNGEEYEPFGFRDAIAKPTVITGANRTPHEARTLLFRDRLAPSNNCFGTFVVYGKLEQDVSGFWQAAGDLGTKLGWSANYAAARIIGRDENGTALVNDFSQDPQGTVCPFQAHIRKVNPQFSSAGHPIVVPLYRRGTPYQTDNTTGLLFLSMQENIGVQFGRLMRTWVNSADFPVSGTGTDSLVGRPGGVQNWDGILHDVGRHVTFRGGEFFFLPSLAFFHSLDG